MPWIQRVKFIKIINHLLSQSLSSPLLSPSVPPSPPSSSEIPLAVSVLLKNRTSKFLLKEEIDGAIWVTRTKPLHVLLPWKASIGHLLLLSIQGTRMVTSFTSYCTMTVLVIHIKTLPSPESAYYFTKHCQLDLMLLAVSGKIWQNGVNPCCISMKKGNACLPDEQNPPVPLITPHCFPFGLQPL